MSRMVGAQGLVHVTRIEVGASVVMHQLVTPGVLLAGISKVEVAE